jgi:hypothetical protein
MTQESQSQQNITIKTALLTPSGQSGDSKALNVERMIASLDYYEDLLSPAVSCVVNMVDTNSVYSKMNLRGYERLDLKIGTAFGDWDFTDENTPFYVNSVNGLLSSESSEGFQLSCTTKENLDNEATRCRGKYEKSPIHEHVNKILTDTLGTDRIGTIESTSNAYGFYGNSKKPFHVCTWLGPKSISKKQGVSGTSGKGTKAKTRGSSGFLFYENYDGFHFRSIDSLVSDTVSSTSTDKKEVPVYTYTSVAEQGGSPFKIIHYVLDKNTDIFKNMRVGMYSNLTYFFNPYDWEFDAFTYKMTESVSPDMGQFIPIPGDDLPDKTTRIMVRIGDQGMFDKSGSLQLDSGRDNADMAKSFSRYNLMFLQSLNIVVPCNVKLRVGDIIRVVLPSSGPSDSNKEADQTQSGNYLIRSLRHHFEVASGNNITSLNLVRDCYGLSL